jgi:hypothetical protein
MSDTTSNIVDLTRMTRQQRPALPLSTDVAQAIENTVCVSGRWPCGASTPPPAASTSSLSPAARRGRISAGRVRTRPGGCAWLSAERAGTSTQNRCLRISAKSHVDMVLGDQAYERGAWAPPHALNASPALCRRCPARLACSTVLPPPGQRGGVAVQGGN